jgi:predicted transcriptional regulator
MITNTGKDIIERIFESITITYQQINQDMSMNFEMVTSTFTKQFSDLSNIITSNFNIFKLDFQEMDRNEKMMLLSYNEIKNDIQSHSTILNSINANLSNIPNVINYIFQETIAAFTTGQRKENDFNQGFCAINWEIQNQGKEFRKAYNKWNNFENMELKHQEIMMIEFKGTKEMAHINFNQINETKTNIQMQLSQNMNTLEENNGELIQTMIEKFEIAKNDTYNWLSEIKVGVMDEGEKS